MRKPLPRALKLASAGAAMVALGAFPTVNVAAREAQATRPQLNSGIVVQNLSTTSPANLTITMVNSDGTAALTVTDTNPLAAGASRNYYVPVNPLFAGLPDGFNGGAVIDSDQPIAASVNLASASDAGGSDADPYRLTTYTGFASTDAAQTLYFPEVTRYGGYNSVLSIQNAGSGTTNVTVTYRDSSGNLISNPGCTTTASIPANASASFKQADCTGLGNTFNGAAVVTADAGGKIAGVAIKANSFTNSSTSQFLDYNGMATGAKKLYVPKVVNGYYGFDGAIIIQNLDSSTSTQVVVTYTFGSTTKTVTRTVNPQASVTLFSPNVVADDNSALPTGSGSAIITSSATNIVATVNERNDTLGLADTYRAFVDGTQTTKLSFPSINSAYYGFTSGPAIQNTGSSAATCTITFTGTVTGQAGTVTKTITTPSIPPNGGQFQQNAYSMGLPADFNGSASATCTQPVFAISSLAFLTSIDTRYGTKYGDSESIVNALNLS
ncbi:MAG TPA: hypothetical protein VFC93_02120 [Chloroflexota bacterium]|nr:hypothetical protein [Chloroflexota bacterium]